MSAPRTWLCPTEADRRRLLDMDLRIGPTRRVVMITLAGALLAAGPWVGFWTLIPLAVAAAAFAIADHGIELSRYPEYRAAASWAVSQGCIAISIALVGGPDTPAVAWLVIPAVTLAARFNRRGMIAGLLYTAALMVAVTVGVNPAHVAAHPQLLIFPLALLAGVVMLSSVLMASDVEHRNDAAHDPLTGLLNRKALGPVFEELAQHGEASTREVGMIMADIDHFKRINDTRGHAVGDAVLKEVADVLRACVRDGDAVYRMGGEEFLVLLPGTGLDGCTAVAERIRHEVAAQRPAGIELSISLGVSVADAVPVALDRALESADVALYSAKQQGRDRVVVAEPAVAA